MDAENDSPTAGGTPEAQDARAAALTRAVREVEQDVATRHGWDAPVLLYALIRTADVVADHPQLADGLGTENLAEAVLDPEHLTPVLQEEVQGDDPVAVLAQQQWSDLAAGAAVVIERLVLPPDAEADMPDDELEAIAWAQRHPRRREVRLAAAVLRDGSRACAVRARDADSADRVAVGPDLVPDLAEALLTTFA